MRELHRGESGYQVELLKRLLLQATKGTSVHMSLSLDPFFDEETEAGLKAFQSLRHMKPTGVCDSATWRAIGLTLERLHTIQPLGQPDDHSCWSTAASIILGNFTPTVTPDQLAETGGLRNELEVIQRFGDRFGWRMLNHGATAAEVIELLFRTPLWIATTTANSGHAVVLAGMEGNGTPFATAVTIFDPSPVGQGSVYTSFLDRLVFRDRIGNEIPASLNAMLIPD